MQIFYKLLGQDANTREGVVISVATLSIFVNLILAALKIGLGLVSSSIAIMSEGVNHAADSGTALLTIVGTKLAKMHPTRKHPFGFGRIEYLTSLVVAALIIFTSFEILRTSISLIFEPVALEISYTMVGIIAVSAIIKLALGQFTVAEAKRTGSNSLLAVGIEAKMDALRSVVTILSSLAFLIFNLSLDAYAGLSTSLFIMKSGWDIVQDTLSDLLGRAGDKELASKLYKIIRKNPLVINAADLMLHNYGPDTYSGSANIEVDQKRSSNEIYAEIHKLQLMIMHELKITMVFGIYAVDNDHELLKDMRLYIVDFIRKHQHIISYHALYVDSENNDIYLDFVVDYYLEDWDELRKEFIEYMNLKYPGQKINLVIETEYV